MAIQPQNDKLISLQSSAKLYLQIRGFSCEQLNGQRVTINQNIANLPKDIKDNEVFVGKLPRDLFENELLPFMESAGRVYKIRLMMDFGQTNRGYAFVRYMTPEEAKLATALLDGKPIRNECPVGVLASFDNKRLFIGNLPNMPLEKLERELRAQVAGIQKVQLHDKSSKDVDKRFALITFQSHTHATDARRLLLPGNARIGDRALTVDWAKAESTPASNSSGSNNNHNRCFNVLGIKAQQLLRTSPPVAGRPLAPSVDNILVSPSTTSTSSPIINNNNYLIPSTSPFNDPFYLDNNRITNKNMTDYMGNLLPKQISRNSKSSSLSNFGMLNNNYNGHDFNNNEIDSDINLMFGWNGMNSNFQNHQHHQSNHNTILIENINLRQGNNNYFKSVFELAGNFKINQIYQHGPTSLIIDYKDPRHAQLMVETILLKPYCFSPVALPNQLLTADRYYS